MLSGQKMLRFRRITTQKRFIPQIDGLRFVAIASVVFFHIFLYGVKHLAAPLHIGQNFWAYYALQAAMILPAVILFCGVFFLLVERPCMDRQWPAKLWRKLRTLLSAGQSQAPALDEGRSVDVPL